MNHKGQQKGCVSHTVGKSPWEPGVMDKLRIQSREHAGNQKRRQSPTGKALNLSRSLLQRGSTGQCPYSCPAISSLCEGPG